MSGDIDPRSCFCACLTFIQTHPNVHLNIVGDSSLWDAFDTSPYPHLSFVESFDVVNTHDSLRDVMRNKNASSMYKAIAMLANQDAHACVSAGNTAALLAIGSRLLNKVAHVTRPAIARAMPTKGGSYVMLDLGATVDCSPEQLLEFALMGAAIAQAQGAQNNLRQASQPPKVALLSNGHEPEKGNKTLRAAQALLARHDGIEYAGFIEGDALFDTTVDVVVCDGLVGNVALKVSEGAARFVAQSMHDHSQSTVLNRFKTWCAGSMFKQWQATCNPDTYNGAVFAGFDAVLVKSHGSATQTGFLHALEFAYQQAEQQAPQKLAQSLSQFHSSFHSSSYFSQH